MTHSNPNLTPVHIVDKNGHNKTVYVSKADATRDVPTLYEGRYGGNGTAIIAAPPARFTQPGLYGLTVTTTRHSRHELLPRKKKPRDVTYEDSVWVPVLEVTKDDAAVAMTWGAREYRAFDGNLYTRLQSREGDPEIAESFFANRSSESSQGSYQDAYQEYEDQYLVIDGEVWEKSGEPVYYIKTEWFINRETIEIGVREARDDLASDSTFSALERDLAIAKMKEQMGSMNLTAYWDGKESDHPRVNAEKSIDELPEIAVSDPALVGSTFRFPNRVQVTEFDRYKYPYDSPTRDRDIEVAARTTISDYRKAAEKVGALIDNGDGTISVDRKALPDSFYDNYKQAVQYLVENDLIV